MNPAIWLTPLTIAAISTAVVAGIVIDQREEPAPTVAGTVVERTDVGIAPNLIRIDCATNPLVEVFDSSVSDRATPIDVCPEPANDSGPSTRGR